MSRLPPPRFAALAVIALAAVGLTAVAWSADQPATTAAATTAAAGSTTHSTATPTAPPMSMEGEDYWSAVAGTGTPPSGRTRTYFIGADEIVWDYAPAGTQPDHRPAIRRGRRRLRHDRTWPDRLEVHEVRVSPLHGRIVPSPGSTTIARSLPGIPRPGHPGRSWRHHQDRLPERLQLPGERPSSRCVLREAERGRPVRRRNEGREAGRRRGRPRRTPYLHLGGAGAGWTWPRGRQLGDVDVPLPH